MFKKIELFDLNYLIDSLSLQNNIPDCFIFICVSTGYYANISTQLHVYLLLVQHFNCYLCGHTIYINLLELLLVIYDTISYAYRML